MWVDFQNLTYREDFLFTARSLFGSPAQDLRPTLRLLYSSPGLRCKGKEVPSETFLDDYPG